MKIKRTKYLLYIFSAVMVLGLALISFDIPEAVKQTGTTPTQAPTKTPALTPTQAATQAPENTETPTPTPTPTSTPTPTPTNTPTPTPSPTPTPTPSLAQVNATIEIRPATDETGAGLTTLLTDYLTNYYKDEDFQVNQINNVTCYYKEGLVDVNYIVYVSYDILYEGSNVPVPTFEEYLIKIDGENITIHTDSENPDVKEALLLSRASKSISELHIKELIRCYMNAKLAVDEALLASLVTDFSYLNIENIRKTTEYIEEYRNLSYLIYPCPDTISEFDYVVYVACDSKIVNINTPAPGLDEYLIKLDENNYPYIFLGVTSSESDNYRMELRKSEEYNTYYETIVYYPLVEAMLSDSSLKDFIERLYLDEEDSEN